MLTSTYDPAAHAEVTAIRRASAALGSFQLDGCDFYTSCDPCPLCLGAIYWARPVQQRHIPMKQVLGDEALAGFLEWRKSTAEILY